MKIYKLIVFSRINGIQMSAAGFNVHKVHYPDTRHISLYYLPNYYEDNEVCQYYFKQDRFTCITS